MKQEIDTSKRQLLQAAASAGLLIPEWARAQSAAVGETLIRINIPGPNSLPFLPIELIPILNFDHELGARLAIRYQPSGIRAIEDVLAGNADLAAFGFPTLPVLQSKGKDVVAIAPLSGRIHPLAVIVRRDLAGSIRRIADLKGRTIATSTGSINSKTRQQMAAQSLLQINGVGPDQVRWLPTAQNWESISGALLSKAADAVFCEEPFASRAVSQKLGVMLADLTDPEGTAPIPGLNHLRAAVSTTRSLVQAQPQKLDLFVRMLRRSLAWVQATPVEQVAQLAPAISAEERQEIAALLKRAPGIYSPDGRFVAAQIAETDVFLRAAMPGLKLPSAESVIDSRWAGLRQ